MWVAVWVTVWVTLLSQAQRSTQRHGCIGSPAQLVARPAAESLCGLA